MHWISEEVNWGLFSGMAFWVDETDGSFLLANVLMIRITHQSPPMAMANPHLLRTMTSYLQHHENLKLTFSFVQLLGDLKGQLLKVFNLFFSKKRSTSCSSFILEI